MKKHTEAHLGDAIIDHLTTQGGYANHSEALKNDRKGQHSIRVNDQWRICFRWQGQDASDVEIADYH